MRASHPPIRRMIFIDQLLRNKKYPNCTTIAREFEVSPKTIHRDIDFLRDQLKAPIEFSPKKNGYYYSEDDYFLPALHFRKKDVFLFIVNEKIIDQYKETPYYKHIKDAIEKLFHYLPDEISTDEMGSFLSFHQPPKTAVEKHRFEIFQDAIQNQLQLKIKYLSQYRNVINDRQIDPYLLHCHLYSWYLIAFCHMRHENRIFALHRILAIEKTEKTFKKPVEKELNDFFKDSFDFQCGGDLFHIKLKFNPCQSRWIRERQWHSTQRLKEMKDGGLILEMDVKGLDEIKRWIMQYGAEVEVIKPKVLREMVKDEVERMGELY